MENINFYISGGGGRLSIFCKKMPEPKQSLLGDDFP